jgi:hypothetical protein
MAQGAREFGFDWKPVLRGRGGSSSGIPRMLQKYHKSYIFHLVGFFRRADYDVQQNPKLPTAMSSKYSLHNLATAVLSASAFAFSETTLTNPVTSRPPAAKSDELFVSGALVFRAANP